MIVTPKADQFVSRISTFAYPVKTDREGCDGSLSLVVVCIRMLYRYRSHEPDICR